MIFKSDVSIVIAGEAGQGIQSIEALLTALAKKGLYHVFATKEYMSRVRGGCNSTEIRVSCVPVSAGVDRIDLLIPLSPEALRHLAGRMGPDTIVVGEREAIGQAGMLDVPFTRLALSLGSAVYANTVAVGAICAFLDMDPAACAEQVRDFFSRKGGEVAGKNAEAFRIGYDAWKSLKGAPVSAICADPAVADGIMVTGAEAIALGALAGGCDYVSAYPMSPGTTVLHAMADYSRNFDLIVEQVEDEIGVANMALGAWYAGSRALVTTSGGGFALMGEAVSLAGATETPLVVHIAQRPGPATGLPTRTEQGDLGLAIHAGHGDFLRIVLAPGDLTEGFELAKAAFGLADEYQSPVFVLTDQYFVDSYYTVPVFEVPNHPPKRHTAPTDPSYRRYALGGPDGISPRGVPGLGKGLVRVDSDEHDEDGFITESATVRKAMVEKRLVKTAAARKAAIEPRLYGQAGAAFLLVGWGSVKEAVLEALKAIGRADVAFLHFPWVYPVPAGAAAALAASRTLIAVEGNATGELADLLASEAGARIERRILKYDGSQFGVEELVFRISAELGREGRGA